MKITYDSGDGTVAMAVTLGLEILDDLWVRVVPMKPLEAKVDTASTFDVFDEAIELKAC